MANKPAPLIYFSEVSSDDREAVLKLFPQAKISTKVLSENKLIADAKDAEVLCSFVHTKISAKVINSLKKLKIIVTRSVGYDHIDLATAKKKGIIVCNVPDYGSHVIAEFVFALLLSGIRHIEDGDNRVERSASFNFDGLKGMALKGKTLGIVGTGKIGLHVARIARQGFLMNVLASDPNPNKRAARKLKFKYVSLPILLKSADIITLHCPLLPSTKHLINRESLKTMKMGAVIVNTSRGGVINDKALTAALKSGQISAAFLDVLENESELKKDKELIKIPSVITTPHIAFYADSSMAAMYQNAFDSIKSYLRKKRPINQVVGI